MPGIAPTLKGAGFQKIINSYQSHNVRTQKNMTQSITNYAVATVAAFALVLAFAATPASASMNSSYIKIEVDNNGSIDNTTKAKAETGGNWAGGSKGGRGGSGGDVEVDGSGDYNNGGADAGNGGNGANANTGGLVTTGDANADAGTVNSLNTTDVEIDLYGEDMNSSKVKLDVDNGDRCECESNIDNTTRARARTGGNSADGSEGGKGGSGGEIEVDGNGDNNNGGASAGNGGTGGTGGLGGEVWTGEANANAGTVNVLNAVLARILL